MTEFSQFLADNWMLSGAWLVVALALATIQLRMMATGPKGVSPQQLTNLVNRAEAILIDIRGQGDFSKGHIQGARNIPLSQLKDQLNGLEKEKDKPMIMVCANGIQVSSACSLLSKHGFSQVYKLTGGMSAWLGDSLPVVKS